MDTLTRMPRTQLLVGMALVILIAELFANSIIGSGASDAGGWIGLSLFGIVVMLLLVLVVVPRIPHEARRNWVLGLGVAAVITCAVFWSALPFAIAAATFVAAAPGRGAPGRNRSGAGERRSDPGRTCDDRRVRLLHHRLGSARGDIWDMTPGSDPDVIARMSDGCGRARDLATTGLLWRGSNRCSANLADSDGQVGFAMHAVSLQWCSGRNISPVFEHNRPTGA